MRQMTNRKPVAAGVLYPKSANELTEKIEHLLASQAVSKLRDPKVIVVPQGNYDDVGELYASSYNAVKGKKYDVVLILSYADTEFFNYLSIFSGEEYSSPLGSAKMDILMRDELADEDDDIYVSEKGHSTSDPFIELQIPWLQTVLEPGFKIVPLVFGHQTDELCQELDKALSEVLTQRSALIVVCSDMVYTADSKEKTIEQHNASVMETFQGKTMDNFFSRKWKDKFKSGAFGPLYVGKNVAANLGYKIITQLGQKTVKEIRNNNEVWVSYQSMVISR